MVQDNTDDQPDARRFVTSDCFEVMMGALKNVRCLSVRCKTWRRKRKGGYPRSGVSDLGYHKPCTVEIKLNAKTDS
jgi:hypothetical protein